MCVWKVLITLNSTHKTHSHTSICIDAGFAQMHIYGNLMFIKVFCHLVTYIEGKDFLKCCKTTGSTFNIVFRISVIEVPSDVNCLIFQKKYTKYCVFITVSQAQKDGHWA